MAIRLEYSTVAKCRPEHVWQKFSKIEQWAWWNPAVGAARWLEGEPWSKGSRFSYELMRPKQMKFKPVILESQPPNTLAWVATLTGVRGEHWFRFEEQPDGTTKIATWEDFSGFATIFFGKKTKEAIVDTYKLWVGRLKEEAEKIAREEYARK